MNNPLKTNENGLTWKGNRLSYRRKQVAIINHAEKVLHITIKKIPQAAVWKLRDIAWLASRNGYHVTHANRIDALIHS